MIGKIRYFIRVLIAKFYLKFKCPRCSEKRRKQRDINNKGDCFWYCNWKKGNYDIESYYYKQLMKKLKKKKN